MTDSFLQDAESPSAPYTLADWSLIICERRGVLGSRLRKALGSEVGSICETRSVAECLGEFQRFPAGLGIVEATPRSVERVLGLLWTLHQHFALARVIVFADRELKSLETLTLELGAVHFAVFPPRDLRPVIDIIRHHRTALPEPNRSLTEHILAGLPWGED